MFVNRQRDLSLKCFSPPVMLVTFLIEVAASLWVLVKYKNERAAQIIILLLTCLAIFQLAEYVVCEGLLGMSGLTWSRIGYVAISFLPPLGLHLGMVISQRDSIAIRYIAYTLAISFSIFFLTVGNGIIGQTCGGNYVIFHVAPEASLPYGAYYYGWLLVGIFSAWRLAKTVNNRKKSLALRWLAVGYLAFLVPTTTVNIIHPETISGIPSIMCGFAVLLAMVLLFKISPLILKCKASHI